MNWGKGLIIAMVIFMGFILTLVITMLSTTVDLDNEEYYKRDLAFEGEMQALANVRELESKIDIIQDEVNLYINVPASEKITDVKVIFRRPNNIADDFEISMGTKRVELINKNDLKKGIYNIEISYKANEAVCLQRERILI